MGHGLTLTLHTQIGNLDHGQAAPSNAGVLVGQGDRGNVVMAPVYQALKPGLGWSRLGLQMSHHRACSMDLQSTQIRVPPFADPEQLLFPS